MNKTTPLNNLYCSLRKVGRRIREGSHHIVGHSNVFRLELRSSDNFEIKVFFYLKSLFGKLLPKFRLTNLFAFQKTIQTRLIQTTKIEIRMVIGHIDWSSELETRTRIRSIQVTPSTTALCDRFRFSLNSKTFLIIMAYL